MKKIRFRDTISTKMDFLLWKGDDGMRKNKGEKVVKSRAGWKKADQVRKIKIVMTFVVVALCISIAAGAVLAWIEIEQPFAEEPSSAPVSSQPPVSSEVELPVYDNTFNLVVVNLDTPLPDDFTVQLEEYEGFSFEERIVEALSKMVEDARADGIALEIAGGYISKEEQDAQYQAAVQQLMEQEGYSRVRAEDQAEKTVGRGGYNEWQTGMLVDFSSSGEDVPFEQSQAYQWLMRNCVNYGFVLRYPENKTSATGTAYTPSCFRYVGTENAVKMREYSMCLEEYAQYIRQQSAN